MAKIELRHLDCTTEDIFVTAEVVKLYSKSALKIDIWCKHSNRIVPVILDKSTAIRFAKTVRTEINKIEG